MKEKPLPRPTPHPAPRSLPRILEAMAFEPGKKYVLKVNEGIDTESAQGIVQWFTSKGIEVLVITIPKGGDITIDEAKKR